MKSCSKVNFPRVKKLLTLKVKILIISFIRLKAASLQEHMMDSGAKLR